MKLTQKQIDERKQKALSVVNTKVLIDVSQRAISLNEEKKTAVFVMSTSDPDRHTDIVDQETWILDYFVTNPSFYFQHESYDFPIGKWLKVWLENDPNNAGKKMLVGEAEFATEIYDKAQLAWDMVKGGYMNMCSVGFIPHRVEYDETKDCFVLYDCELLECSLVGTGSNRRALVRDAVSAIIEVKDALVAEVKLNPTVHNAAQKAKAAHILNKVARSLVKTE